ncbi:MAG: hypothetical protein ABI658_29950 [Acidimicrobiales bacterium]
MIEVDNASFGADPIAITPNGRFSLMFARFHEPTPYVEHGANQLYRFDAATASRDLVSAIPGTARPTGSAMGSVGGAMSDDGRWIAFYSQGDDIVPGAGPGLFLRDMDFGVTTFVGAAFPFAGQPLQMTGDGRYLLFPGQFGVSSVQVYRYDRMTGAVLLVSGDASPLPNDAVSTAMMSADGSLVAFISKASNLAAGDLDHNSDAFLRDIDAGTTSLISTAGASAVGAVSVVISADGSTLAFQSYGLAGSGYTDPYGGSDVYSYAIGTGAVTLVNAIGGTTTCNGNSEPFGLSADGRSIVFGSTCADLVAGVSDTNKPPDQPPGHSGRDVFVKRLDTGTTHLVSTAAAGNATANDDSFDGQISADGDVVAFASSANNLVPSLTDANQSIDVFVRRMSTGEIRAVSLEPGLPYNTLAGTSADLFLAADGAHVLHSWRSPGPWSGGMPIVRALEPNGLTFASRFIPVTPTRILDTRIGFGAPQRPLDPGEAVPLLVAGRGGVPLHAVSAVVVNVTSVGSSAAGYVTAWPLWRRDRPTQCAPMLLCYGGAARPEVSNLNVEEKGQTIPNLATVPLGPSGWMNIFSYGGGDLLVDIEGYYTPATTSSSGRFVALTPHRVLDSRIGLGAAIGPVAGLGVIDLAIGGVGGVPPAGASAVALNVTAAEAAGPGYVTVWPDGVPQPNASNLNLTRPGQTAANFVVVPLGANGHVRLFTYSQTHLLADVAGWFTDNTQPTSTTGLFVPTDPLRVLDTRDPSRTPAGAVAAVGTARLSFDPATAVPSNATAVAFNLTATQSLSPGYVTAWPAADPRPEASNLNIDHGGQTIANFVIVARRSNGVDLFHFGGGHLIADLAGWFTG